MTQVLFRWSGCPGVYAASWLLGVVLETRTSRAGIEQLLVKAPELNLAKWVPAAEAKSVAPATPKNVKAAVHTAEAVQTAA